MPLSYLSSGLQLVGNIVNTQQVNDANMKIQQMINQNNRELVATQNAQAKQEAELAYKRSSAPNQVALLTSAGMSRAGAINALNGGGSYTPAPVNTSQDSAAQMQTSDLSPLANIAQIAMQEKQMKQQERLQDKQIKAQAVEAQKQRDHELLLADTNAANVTQGQYLDYTKHQERLKFDYQNAMRNWRKLDKEVAYIEKQTESLGVQIEGQELDNMRKRMENANYPTMARLMNEKAMREIESMILLYNQSVENHTLDKQAKELNLRYEKLTQDYKIDAENLRNELSAYMDSVHLGANQGGLGILACLEILTNNYMPTLASMK